MKLVRVLSVLIFLLLCLSLSFSRPVDVLLEPAETGKPSRIVPSVGVLSDHIEVLPYRNCFFERRNISSEPLSVDVELAYDNGSFASSLGGLAQDFHLGVWFQSPSACTLLEVRYYLAISGSISVYAVDPSDTIDFLNDYYEYHGGPNPSGPDPRETFFLPETSFNANSGAWINVFVPSMPDVGTNVFYAAYIMDDINSSPIIDASVSPPYHTLMYRIPSGGVSYGWYTSWHHVYIRALVRMYENPPPVIETYDDLPNSYLTTIRPVTATFSDFGIPPESSGVAVGRIFYRIDNGSWDSIPMSIISGDSTYGVWEGILPGINPGQRMEYYFKCIDYQGFSIIEPFPGNPVSYMIRERTSDILFVNDDYYGGSFSYDVVSDVISTADQWEINTDGVPDSSVLLAGYNVIIWNSWGLSGPSLAQDSLLIGQYLNSGGDLLVSGMDIPAAEFGYSWGSYVTSPGEFLYDYFEIVGGTDDFATDSISTYYGVSGDTITEVFASWPLTVYPYYFAGPGYNYNGKFDENILNPQYWHGILADTAGNFSGFRFSEPGVYKVVWLYFPFAYIEDSLNPGNPHVAQQQELIERILNWFAPAPLLNDVTQYNTTAALGPYPVDVTVVNFVDSLLYVNLIYSADGVEDTMPMTPVKSDTSVYTGSIPSYSQTTHIEYHVEAMDADSNCGSSDEIEFWCFVPSGVVFYVDESYDPVLDYENVLDTLNPVGGYDVYDPYVHGVFDSTLSSLLASYSAVIWNGDWGYGTILTKESATNVLYDYFLAGGNIFFGSDEILGFWDMWSDTTYTPGEFPYDVLKVDYIYNDIMYDDVYGVTGDTISNGINANLTFPLTNWNDEVGILDSADSIFTDNSGSTIRGVKWEDANNKVVFIPFMYVSLPYQTQVTVMRRVLEWFGIQTGIAFEDTKEVPRLFSLSQNRPNPFTSKTTIRYSLPKKTRVSLDIYDSSGRFIKTLVSGIEEPGYKSVVWNGRDRNNGWVAQGVYFYRLEAGDFRATKKILLLR
jgi:hypothetical protein